MVLQHLDLADAITGLLKAAERSNPTGERPEAAPQRGAAGTATRKAGDQQRAVDRDSEGLLDHRGGTAAGDLRDSLVSRGEWIRMDTWGVPKWPLIVGRGDQPGWRR